MPAGQLRASCPWAEPPGAPRVPPLCGQWFAPCTCGSPQSPRGAVAPRCKAGGSRPWGPVLILILGQVFAFRGQPAVGEGCWKGSRRARDGWSRQQQDHVVQQMELQQVLSLSICFVWLSLGAADGFARLVVLFFFFSLFSLPDIGNTGEMFILTTAESPLEESINLCWCCFYSLTAASVAFAAGWEVFVWKLGCFALPLPWQHRGYYQPRATGAEHFSLP